ncbi:MAG: ABC transporter permease subunit [Anaerolineales bacterium]|nr:ABC transporter permease subunit [Anaerolineales bacterium]MCB9128495.1 ABC transporter permease subunit [Ardenticatenales bacterium]MCB9172665.1 ABC transporter permease subunit [Ardenticatenales bacterium]
MIDQQFLIGQIQSLYQSGKAEDAHRLLDDMLSQQPSSVDLWELRAQIARNEWEARRAWQQVLSLQPSHAEALIALGPPTMSQPRHTPALKPIAGSDAGATFDSGRARESRRFAWPRRDAWLGVARQLGFWLVVLLALIFLTFFGLEMARSGDGGEATRYAATSTVSYLGQAARGDLGTVSDALSQLDRPVTDLLREVVPKSLGLLAVSLLFATVVGTVLGTLAALRKGQGWSLALIMLSIIGVSVPSFLAAILLQWGVLRYMRLFDVPAPLPLGGFGWDSHIILPMLVLAARPVAQITRVTFITLREVLDEDYIRVAQSKGLSRSAIFFRHVIRNVMIPVLTTIGLSLRFSLSSLPVVELFFGWPGVGQTLLQAISRRDDNLTVALILSLGLLFIAINLLLEIAYRLIDPRLRAVTRRTEGASLADALRGAVSGVASLLTDNPLTRWWRSRNRVPEVSPFAEAVARAEAEQQIAAHHGADRHRWDRARAWLRGTVQNLPLILGTIVVGGLLFVALFGSSLAPSSPYTTNVILKIGDAFRAPPFPQSVEFPWGSDFLGRDLQSLVLAGARQTLLLAGWVVLGRMLIGIVLGAIAGWTRGSLVDRTIQSASELLSAFPTLLLAMILILGFGIRQGLRPFVYALVFVGWGEVMQYVRSQVIAIKPKPFIESAYASGLPASRIVLDHVMPHLLPTLLSIAALEMGATLMILGELGFIGIFIGGGIITEGGGIHYSDVPEWAALLANVRRYVRSYPWMALYPAMAFFVAILGFNLFGEGMRRLIDNVGFNIMRLFNRYTLALALVLFLSWGWIQDNTGEAVVYRQQASFVQGDRALADVEALTDNEMTGRAIDSAGLSEAQQYIVDQLREIGVQTAGEEQTYFQPQTRSVGRLATLPVLQIDDGGEPLLFHEDFAELPDFFRNVGDVSAPVTAVIAGELSGTSGRPQPRHYAFRQVDLSESIVLVTDPALYPYVRQLPAMGMLLVAQDESWIGRSWSLGVQDPTQAVAFARDATGDMPRAWITPEVANRLLASADTSIDGLRQQAAALPLDTVELIEVEPEVQFSMNSEREDDVPTANIIGYIPGTSNDYDNRMIVLMTKYDSPPLSPDGERYDNANFTGSGPALLLEVARAIQESPYQPYKTILLVFYSDEGQDGGNWVQRPEMQDLLQAKYGFSGTDWDVEAIIDVSGVGAGSGGAPEIVAGGSLRLASLFERAARRMNTGLATASEPVDISVIYSDEARPSVQAAQDVPSLSLHWQGWEANAGHRSDDFASIQADYLARSARLLAYAVMEFGRDISD